MSKVKLVPLIFATIIFTTLGYSLIAQETTPEPLVPAPKSLFADDTCAPPCWFGLDIGLSTSEDIRLMFEAKSNVFNWRCVYCVTNEENQLTEGYFVFEWIKYNRYDTPITPYTYRNDQYSNFVLTSIETDRLDSIYVYANTKILLGDFLENFGIPDVVYMDCGYYDDFTDVCYLEFSYLTLMMNIELHSYPDKDCLSDTIKEIFVVDRLIYHSLEASAIVDKNTLYPRLIAPSTGYRQVRGDDWERFINGEGYETCNDFLKTLPKDVVLPPLPSFLSTPEATSTP